MTECAVAFDVDTLDQALELDRRLGTGPEYAKIGLQLFTSAGPDAVRALAARGRRVFLDLKLHDIPNTVRGAAAAAAGLGVELITVHALGGPDMIGAAVEGASRGAHTARIVAVTLLTSQDPERLPPGFARPFALHRVVAEQLEMAEREGASGIVCSAADLAGIRAHHAQPFYSVTPGIRPASSSNDDQKRVTTVAEAVRAGASLLVLGRAVTAAADPAEALARARDEVREAGVTARP
jgi:orotidine-5'-phosphate decarboxylase